MQSLEPRRKLSRLPQNESKICKIIKKKRSFIKFKADCLFIYRPKMINPSEASNSENIDVHARPDLHVFVCATFQYHLYFQYGQTKGEFIKRGPCKSPVLNFLDFSSQSQYPKLKTQNHATDNEMANKQKHSPRSTK